MLTATPALVSGATGTIRAFAGAIQRALLCIAVFACGGAVVRGEGAANPATDRATVILVIGAPGEAEFTGRFGAWAKRWQSAATQAGANVVTIGLETNAAASDLDRLRQALETEPKESAGELWLVLLGHGTFDGKTAKFNLRGPDFSTAELVAWLKPFKRPVALIDTSASSAPFLKDVSAPGRVVITATRSGHEQNFAYLGQYLAEAIADPAADLDKDGQTSLLEAWLMASRRTAEFYKTEGRLATEHSLLDDNGDGLGTPADWFRGVRAVKKAKEGAPLDGLRAHQFHLVRSAMEEKMPPELRQRRDEIEVKVARLRERKSQLAEEEYYKQLEVLLLEMARLYEQADKDGSKPMPESGQQR